MLLPLRRLSGHLRRAASFPASAGMLLPLRRTLSTAASPSPWAMIYRFTGMVNCMRAASFSLAPPPSASHFSLPERVFDQEDRTGCSYIDYHAGMVFSASGDGLLLLKATRHSFRSPQNLDRPSKERRKELVEEKHVLYVCNPVTGQLVRLLPVTWGTKNLMTATGLLTQADRGHGPPDRYAAAELIELQEVGHFALCRFCSQTGEWDLKERLGALPPGRLMHMKDHEVLAFGGRLWWVDVSWGAVSADPFKEEPELAELGHVKLPEGSVLPEQDATEVYQLIKYRRMGVSDGRLLYVEVSEEEPFQIKSFMLEDESASGRWMLQHQVSLDTLWPKGHNATKERPLIIAIDPFNTDLVHLNMGSKQFVSVDLRRNRIIDAHSVLSSGISPGGCSGNVFLPCVLPSFLGSSLIPGERKTI